MSDTSSISPLPQETVEPEDGRGPLRRIRRSSLVLGLLGLLLLILTVTGVGYGQMESAESRLQAITDLHMKKLALTKTMHMAARNRTLLLHQIIQQPDPFERDAMRLAFDRHGAEFALAREQLIALPLSPGERALLQSLGKAIVQAIPLQGELLDLVHAERRDEAERLLRTQVVPAQDDLLTKLSELDYMSERSARAAAARYGEEYRQTRRLMLTLYAFALLLGVVVAVLVYRQTVQASRVQEHLATHDVLTGLPNRMLLRDRLTQAIAHARRRNEKVGVLFIDLDNFKLINDSLGHAAGDELIRTVASRIRAHIRAEDTVARMGGDEFVLLVVGAGGPEGPMRVAHTLIDALSATYQLAGREAYAGCSIGISLYPDDGVSAETLLKNADVAMYHAKEAGRGRYQLFDPSMHAGARRRLELETAMRKSLERDEFVLHYQPQVDYASDTVCGAEALIRWHHPERGLVPPSEFLALAEKSDLILQIGQRSLHLACSQCRTWAEQGHTELKVALNLSGREFWRGDIVGLVREALQATGLPAQCLQIELTEGILMENVDLAVERVRALKALGVMIAVDDFGTGHSSLAHLKRFPIDVLKIDRYFVKDIERDATDRAIVRAILALADSLNLEVVAEGVESESQIVLLRELGCTRFQGYAISRPLPADQLLAWLQERRPACTGLTRAA